ncbi:uncharacterized protein LOC143229816 [Tachypleus tridentatus]|uniref:uncharacterized protein LOC143229816 n=1 Tax=Tachypleus tridentatus TaxID=6853 RepID=UPI003FD43027
MKFVVFIAVSCLVFVSAKPREKRLAYDFSDGVEEVVGPLKFSFECEGKRYGYYADQDNDCKVFHVCVPQILPDGSLETSQYSFFCNNLTVFNQLTLTCGYEYESIPCVNANDFYYVNDNIGIPDAPFLTEDDVERARAVIKQAYGGGK